MEVFGDLEQILKSKQGGLTPQEYDVLHSCKKKAVTDFSIGAGVASGFAWLATRRLNKLFRISISAGAAYSFGMFRFIQSLDSCADNILTFDGSRMQKELQTIILNKYQDNPWIMQLISKHFYSERVFDDSTLDKPKLRWRHRNFFGDDASHGQRTHDNSHYTPHSDSHNDSHHSQKTELESKQLHVNPGVVMIADPLDCLFKPAAGGEIQPDTTTTTTTTTYHGVLTRRHKRSHRKRGMRRQEVPSDSPLA